MMKYVIILVLTLLAYSLEAQQLPTENPVTHGELIDNNRLLANTFAPNLIQIFGSAQNSLGGNADRITNINFDGDFSNLNNWNTAPAFLPNPAPAAMPNAYFQVHWTETHWLITYTFYYARDHAKRLCGFDEHEGDSGKVFMIVKRPVVVENDSITPASAELATIISGGNITVHDPPVPLNVFASSGSHHFYDNLDDAWDDGINPCNPDPEGIINYLPVRGGSVTKITPLPLPTFPFTSPPTITEAYGFIDIFAAGDVWDNRENAALIKDLDENPQNDQFNLNDGNDNHPASLPWNGRGYDPLTPYNNASIEAQIIDVCPFFPFFPWLCDLSEISIDSTAFGSGYLFNQFMCNAFELDHQEQITLQAGQSTTINIENTLFSMDLVEESEFTWNIAADFDYSCIGCDENSSSIEIVFTDETQQDHALLPVSFTVSFETVDCGLLELSGELIIRVDVPNPYVEFTGLECIYATLTVLDGPADADYHWEISPTVMSSNLNNNPLAIFPEASEFPQFFNYTVTISSDGSSTTLIGSFEIPACDDMQLVIDTYPNPSTGIINVNVSRTGETQVDEQQEYRVLIFDAQQELVRSLVLTQEEFTLNLSNEQNGIYFLTVEDRNQRRGSTQLSLIGH